MLRDVVEGLAVRKALEQGADLGEGLAESGVLAQGVVRLGALRRDVLSVADVLLEVSEEPADGLLVVVAALILDNDLRRRISERS